VPPRNCYRSFFSDSSFGGFSLALRTRRDLAVSGDIGTLLRPRGGPIVESRNEIIAIVDDHVDTAETLGLILRHAGFETAVFTRSLDFLSGFQKLDPALVLLDLAMPECDGRQVLSTLRTTLATAVPVIVLSAHANSADVGELERWGVTEVMRKPVVVEKLVEAVRRAMTAAGVADQASEDAVQHAAKLPPRR
jgi:FixJ family two-component response regulator